MKLFNTLVLLGLACWLGSCSSSRVQADADPIVKLSNYKTFRFTDMSDTLDPLHHSSGLENEMHREIAIELARRGIQEDLRGPGMLIVYHTFTEQKRNSINNYYPMMYGGQSWRMYPWRFTPYPYGHRIGYNHVNDYTEGTLIIDVIDNKTNMLIWRGSLADAIGGPGDVNKKAVKAVHSIFEEFPVQKRRPASRLSEPGAITRN
jgi:hypothetical protein